MVDHYTMCAIHAAREDLETCLALSNRLTDGINRGLDLTERLSAQYKPTDKIPDQVIDYIREYEDTCMEIGWAHIEIKAGCESAMDVVKSIIRSIWNMLTKLWDKIRDCFRWLFNAQYRASRDAVKCSQEIANLKSSKDASEKFLRYEVDALLMPDDLNRYMAATEELIAMMEVIPGVDEPEKLDEFITNNAAKGGLAYKNNRFEDTYGDPPYKRGTYGSLGWDAALAYTASQRYVEICRKTVVLKKIEKDLNNDISDLKRKQNQMVADGSDLSSVQKTLSSKLKKYSLIQAGQSALMERIEVLSEEFHYIAQDAYDVANGTYEENDDE